MIRKKLLMDSKKKFDKRFSVIGDFDLFLKLSKMCFFEVVQTPLASHRLHGKNFSNLNKELEISETELWVKENEHDLNKHDIKKIKKQINFKKFINYKFKANYKECLNMFFQSKLSIFNIKNIIIFFSPSSILKKILWYYQN